MASVLMIMENFAPENNCGAIPNTKLAKYLVREGLDVTLVTKAITPEMNLDENLVPGEMDDMRVLRVEYGSLFADTVQAYRNKITDSGVKLKMKSERRPVRAFAVSVLKETYFWLRKQDWLHSAGKLINKELGNAHFDCIYSTYPDQAAHDLAKKLMKKGMADRWIADFRDPMYYEYHDSFANAQKQRQQIAFERQADHVTIVSEDGLSKFLCDDIPADKFTYIPNGYDPEDFDQGQLSGGKNGDVLRIFYAGTLYAGRRDFSPMFRALSELSAEGQIDLDHVRIEYAGNEWAVMRSFAENYGIEAQCVNYGFITRKQVMEILGEVDCSGVCTHNTAVDKGVVTGKVFELLLVGKPIIAVINGDEPNSELGRIVRSCEAGIVYEQASDEADYPALKAWLKNAYDQKMRGETVACRVNVHEREQYSYVTIARKIAKIIEAK